jgi:hypothetical protein
LQLTQGFVASVARNIEIKPLLEETTHICLIVAPSLNLSFNLVNMLNEWRCTVC